MNMLATSGKRSDLNAKLKKVAALRTDSAAE
jgi:hypothetical protein